VDLLRALSISAALQNSDHIGVQNGNQTDNGDRQRTISSMTIQSGAASPGMLQNIDQKQSVAGVVYNSKKTTVLENTE